MKEQAGIFGYIKVFITDNITGKKRLVFEDKNAIQPAYANAIVDSLDASVGKNYSIDNKFNGNTNLGAGNNGEDGIAIKDQGGLWYEMAMPANVVTVGEVLFVGAFTGVGITIADANSVLFGHSWNNGGLTFDTVIAKPGSWSSQPVLNTETITLYWTIKHQAS